MALALAVLRVALAAKLVSVDKTVTVVKLLASTRGVVPALALVVAARVAATVAALLPATVAVAEPRNRQPEPARMV